MKWLNARLLDQCGYCLRVQRRSAMVRGWLGEGWFCSVRCLDMRRDDLRHPATIFWVTMMALWTIALYPLRQLGHWWRGRLAKCAWCAQKKTRGEMAVNGLSLCLCSEKCREEFADFIREEQVW